MSSEGSVSRVELINWAMTQNDRVAETLAAIDSAMTPGLSLQELESQYAASRELMGKQKILRQLLEDFNANTVIGGREMGKRKGGMATPFEEDDF